MRNSADFIRPHKRLFAQHKYQAHENLTQSECIPTKKKRIHTHTLTQTMSQTIKHESNKK